MITMQDIADSAKVSRGTVSYVLNGKYKQAKISKTTRDRIMTVAEKLGYQCNAIAQSMKTGKTNVIAILGAYQGCFAMDMINGITSAAAENNYLTKFLQVFQIDKIDNAIKKCTSHRVDGIICRSLSQKQISRIKELLEPYNIPVILLDSCFDNDSYSQVISDEYEGARKAVEYLVESGHKKIFHITNEANSGYVRFRRNGYLDTMKSTKLQIPDNNTLAIKGSDRYLAEQMAMIRELILNNHPDAIFCSTDYIAMKTIAVAAELGINVPEKLSVVGFGDLEFAKIANPPLTTVQQFPEKLGRNAFEVLKKHLDSPTQKPIKKVVNTKLILRKSVKQK